MTNNAANLTPESPRKPKREEPAPAGRPSKDPRDRATIRVIFRVSPNEVDRVGNQVGADFADARSRNDFAHDRFLGRKNLHSYVAQTLNRCGSGFEDVLYQLDSILERLAAGASGSQIQTDLSSIRSAQQAHFDDLVALSERLSGRHTEL